MTMFKDIEVVKESVALVVTHASPGKKVEHIENLVNRILTQKSDSQKNIMQLQQKYWNI